MATKALRAHSADILKFDITRIQRAPARLPAGFFIPARTIARIDALTDKSTGPNGAWVWKGSFSQKTGYPQITFKHAITGRYTMMCVHRALVCIREGRRLDRTEYVLHERGQPQSSVNPRHLRIGTQQENLDDAKAEKRLRPRLKPAEVLKIVRLFQKEGCAVRDIAHTMGVSTVSVVNVLSGRTHSKLTGIPLTKGRKPGKMKAA